ncbi:hypothetical protein JOE09_000933 [Pantoea coffeiphila]|nr:hypothetical protein [Pantoea coffeiphila]
MDFSLWWWGSCHGIERLLGELFRLLVCRFGDVGRVPVLSGYRAVLAPLRGSFGFGIRPGGPAETQRPCCDST